MSRPLPLLRHFRKLKDPRLNRRKRHSLEAILVIATCAVIAGANDFQQIALFARKRQAWLERFLPLPHGVPSHDTFERVFARLDPVAFQQCFARWMNAWYTHLTGKQLAIDGKAVCGSASPSKGRRCLHLVNVWATQARLCLGMVACAEDSHEITAIPKLLALLDLEGALVTIDAAGCQKKIAEQVVAAGGDYLLVVKDNQGKLREELAACLERAAEKDFRGVSSSCSETEDLGHGRVEHRRLALNLTEQEPASMSIAQKRFAAALDTDYLEEILQV
jgi:predicted transposase YbfD/YdcC